MNPLISVIVPVYNVEKYLDRCVESIVKQTYTNLEIILVDDGSTDKSSFKCDEWAQKDNRIIAIHKENGGLSDARNVGLEKATGEYIGFVDSDDYIAVNMYQIMFDVLVKTNVDLAECRWKSFSDDNVVSENQIINVDDVSVFSTEEALRELILEKRIKQTVVNKLYKRKIINSFFPVGRINEDDYWTYQVFGNTSKVAYIDLELYFYFQRSNSIMHKKYSINRLDGVNARKERLLYIGSRFPEIESYACVSYLRTCFYHYQVICRNKEVDPELKYRNELHYEYKSFYDKKVIKKLQPLKQRIWMNSFKLFPKFTCKIRNTLKIGL